MSSSSSDPNLPSVRFPEIFEVALEEYMKTTNQNIKSDQLFAKLQECHQQIFKIIVRQCGAHGVDTTGYKVTPSYEQL